MQRFGKSFPARRSQGEMPNTQDKPLMRERRRM
jgi:hypothetical protein